MSTDWKALCAELLEALDGWHKAVFETGTGWVRPDETYLINRARAALAAEPTITRQPEFPGKMVWEQGSTLGIAPDEQTARTDAARAVEPVAAQRTDVAPLQVALARVERLADDFSSACRPLVELAEKLAAGPVAEKAPVVPISVLLHPAYEPGDGSADGAQMVEMAWWHPVMGCDSLQIVVDNARAALAEPVAEGPTDEEIIREAIKADLVYRPVDEEPHVFSGFVESHSLNQYVLAFARAVLARWGRQPAPPAEGEVAELVAWLHGRDGGIGARAAYSRIADLLSQRHPAPVPVSERLPSASRVYFEFVISDADYCTQAGGIAPTYAQALSEGQHYLAQYQQDGPHTLELRRVEVLPPGALPLPQGDVDK